MGLLRALARRRNLRPVRGSEAPLPPTGRVAHGESGKGSVQRYEGDKMVGLFVEPFDEVGCKTFDVGIVRERGLLAPTDEEPRQASRNGGKR